MTWVIRTPGELAHALRVASDNLEDGTLEEVAGNPDGSVLPMLQGAGWPDIISAAFTCATCRARFHLTCETYHGRGGAWTFDPG